jgi:hypothetical protein
MMCKIEKLEQPGSVQNSEPGRSIVNGSTKNCGVLERLTVNPFSALNPRSMVEVLESLLPGQSGVERRIHFDFVPDFIKY